MTPLVLSHNREAGIVPVIIPTLPGPFPYLSTLSPVSATHLCLSLAAQAWRTLPLGGIQYLSENRQPAHVLLVLVQRRPACHQEEKVGHSAADVRLGSSHTALYRIRSLLSLPGPKDKSREHS